jgi:16S rRNA (guanine966-N2)-methyltransferase
MRIIAGRWRGRRLKSVRGRGVRPTSDRVREAWMAAMGPSLEGARVLDLFAGSGALGLEALSRGAGEVVFVERARAALAVLRANVDLLGAHDECTVVPEMPWRTPADS